RAPMLAATSLLFLPMLGAAQAPPTAEHAWPIPAEAMARAAALVEHEPSMPTTRPSDLVHLIDLAERSTPDPPIAWKGSRAGAAAIGLAEAAYLPQLSFQAFGGFERTPLPAPKDL